MVTVLYELMHNTPQAASRTNRSLHSAWLPWAGFSVYCHTHDRVETAWQKLLVLAEIEPAPAHSLGD